LIGDGKSVRKASFPHTGCKDKIPLFNNVSVQGIRTLTASMADSSSFLSREKANSIAAKYLDKLPLKTGKWIMGKRSQNAPKVGLYAVAFKLFS